MTIMSYPGMKSWDSDDRDQLIAHLTEYLIAQWNAENRPSMAYGVQLGDDEDAARDTIARFVELANAQQIGVVPGTQENWQCVLQVVKMLERVLEVDLRPGSSNRKGGIPAAMGLVSRRKNLVRDQVIYNTFDHAMWSTGEPGRPVDECAGLVCAAVAASGLWPADAAAVDGPLSREAVMKIHERERDS